MADQIQVDVILKAVSSGFEKVNDNWTRLKSAISLVETGLRTAKRVYEETIGVTMEYAMQIKDLARNTQLTAEETSRLIQLGDDYAITAGQLSSALEMAVKRGFKPSVENLADLADETAKLHSPTEKAAKLAEIFGKGWETLTPILYQSGDAIREQAAAISDKLILDQEAIDRAEELRVAQDGLNDALLSLSVTAGQDFIPAITKAVEAMEWMVNKISEANDMATALNGQMALILKLLRQQAGVYEEAASASHAYAEAQEATAEATTEAAAAIDDASAATEQGSAVMSEYVQTMLDAASKVPHFTKALTDEEIQLAKNKIALDAEKAGLDRVQFAISGPVLSAFKNYTTALADNKAKQAELTAEIKLALSQGYSATGEKVTELRNSLGELITEEGTLEEQYAAATREIIYQKLAMGLSAQQALDLARNMGLVSETDYNLITATGILNQAFKDGKIGADDLTLASQYLETALADGVLTADELQVILNRFGDKEFTYTFDGEMTGDWPLGSGGGTSGGTGQGGGYGGDDPDPVIDGDDIPDPDEGFGEGGAGGGDTNKGGGAGVMINNTFYISGADPVAIANQVVQILETQVRQAERSGGRWAGG